MSARARVAWLIFFGGFGLETGVDWLWRLSDGDIHTGGFPRSIWFGLHAALAMAAIAYGLLGPPKTVRLSARVFFWCLQAGVAFVLYVMLCLFYGIGTGIDHF